MRSIVTLLAAVAVGAGAVTMLVLRHPAPAGTGEVPAPVARSEVAPLILIGIDGASPDLVRRLAAAGKLPNLQRLMTAGTWGRLRTIEPTVSPAIWTTIATGKLPEEHGILGFEGVPGRTMTTLPTSQMRRVRAFWNILSEHGRSVGVIGWWVTWPAEQVDGYVVSDRVPYTRMEATIGREAHNPYEVFPPELGDPVRALVRGPSALTAEEVRGIVPLSDAEFRRWVLEAGYRHGDLLPEFAYVHQSDRSTADIAAFLFRERPTDVAAVALYGVDAVSHLAWHYMEPESFPDISIPEEDLAKFGGLIENYYAYTDGLVGEILQAAPEDANVIVFSDHGFGPTGRLPWSGGHGRITPGAPIAPDGLLILAGPSIRQGAQLEDADVLDIAPTLLQLQGFAVPEDMTGRVLVEVLEPAFLERVPRRSVATYEVAPLRHADGDWIVDEEMDREMQEKLRALGYIE